jgi:ATP-dependent Lon protease
MANNSDPTKSLPQKPSAEYLRKQAKRVAHEDSMQLAAAQRRLSREYGYRNWADLMTAVRMMASGAGSGTGTDGSSAPSSPPTREGAENVLPLLPLRELVAFPNVSYPIFLGRSKSIKALAFAKEQNTPILLVAQRDATVSEPEPTTADMYEVGAIGAIRETLSLPDGTMKSVIEGKRRARIRQFLFDGEFYRAEAEQIEEPIISDVGLSNLMSSLFSAVRRGSESLGDKTDKLDELEAIVATGNASSLADRIASGLRMKLEFKQALLEVLDPSVRLKIIVAYLNEMAVSEEKWQTMLRRVTDTRQ